MEQLKTKVQSDCWFISILCSAPRIPYLVFPLKNLTHCLSKI